MRKQIKIIGLFLVVLTLVACGVADPGTGADPTTSTTTTTTPPPTTVGPTTTIPDPTTIPEDPLDAAVAKFGEWVAALAGGQTRLAWDLMAPSSQQALGTYERFADWGSGLAEGWGSWVAVEDPSYTLEEDDAGRTLLVAIGTIRPEGQEEVREVAVPVVDVDGELLLSPFEEFGNVAEGLGDDAADQPPVPDNSGEGRRIVYSNSEQRIWLVEADGTVTDTYLVSGKAGVPAPGTYEVFSKSELAHAGYNDITMSHMVRFAHGRTLAIGFHAIPHDGRGRPLQSEDELGEYRSAGCVRQSPGHAAALYEWADIGTPVIIPN